MNPLISTSYPATVTPHSYPHVSFAPGTHFVFREGECLDPWVASDDDVDHKFCSNSVFARILESQLFINNTNSLLLHFKCLPRSTERSHTAPNWVYYNQEYNWILDLFCLLDYQVMPIPADPLAQFKLVTADGKERLPRPPIKIRIAAMRSDISQLSELLRRDFCTELRPDKILEHVPAFFRQRYRVIGAIQKLYTQHAAMLSPDDNIFFFRKCKVCALYDPQIIRFSQDLHAVFLRTFHGEDISPV
ncbi:uncharacterized protein PSANT_04414 [Moesziomyces antarcticus]|nr:uncharacterized protein PSANT_04414 [Moesziomyces antarcticus]